MNASLTQCQDKLSPQCRWHISHFSLVAVASEPENRLPTCWEATGSLQLLDVLHPSPGSKALLDTLTCPRH